MLDAGKNIDFMAAKFRTHGFSEIVVRYTVQIEVRHEFVAGLRLFEEYLLVFHDGLEELGVQEALPELRSVPDSVDIVHMA